jgi:hypothetical protein
MYLRSFINRKVVVTDWLILGWFLGDISLTHHITQGMQSIYTLYIISIKNI